MNLRYEILKACASNPGAPIDEIADAIKLYRKGEIHVAGWTRSMQGPAMPTYRWGAAWMCRARPT